MQYLRYNLGFLKRFIQRNIPVGHRTIVLHKLAYQEENLKIPTDRQVSLCKIIMFPRSFVERVEKIPLDKVYDYNFLGTLFLPEVHKNRKWIIDFAQENFTASSYYCITDAPPEYQLIGSYDRSLDNRNQRFVPKFVGRPALDFFDESYFQILRQSRFTLCPAGDCPWSMRFFESIMCQSIPILNCSSHAGRNRSERSIGYKFYLKSERHEYREDWVQENYDKFIARQTLINQVTSRGARLAPLDQ